MSIGCDSEVKMKRFVAAKLQEHKIDSKRGNILACFIDTIGFL